jgi:hypothetical protein
MLTCLAHVTELLIPSFQVCERGFLEHPACSLVRCQKIISSENKGGMDEEQFHTTRTDQNFRPSINGTVRAGLSLLPSYAYFYLLRRWGASPGGERVSCLRTTGEIELVRRQHSCKRWLKSCDVRQARLECVVAHVLPGFEDRTMLQPRSKRQADCSLLQDVTSRAGNWLIVRGHERATIALQQRAM